MNIRVITKLPNSEQSYKGKVKTHNYKNRQNQSTTGKHARISNITLTHKLKSRYNALVLFYIHILV
jgi:hypothetical protein